MNWRWGTSFRPELPSHDIWHTVSTQKVALSMNNDGDDGSLCWKPLHKVTRPRSVPIRKFPWDNRKNQGSKAIHSPDNSWCHTGSDSLGSTTVDTVDLGISVTRGLMWWMKRAQQWQLRRKFLHSTCDAKPEVSLKRLLGGKLLAWHAWRPEFSPPQNLH